MTERLPDDIARAMAEAADRLGAVADRLTFTPVVSSTNDVALRLAADGADDGTTVLAGAQTAGRGRQRHEWFSPPDAGLYFSSVIRGLPSALVTLMAGVAVVEGVRAATGLPVELKWPNDVVLPGPGPPGGRGQLVKLAGILTEASRVGGVADAIIVGIGINVARFEHPGVLAAKASSLEAELGAPVDRAAVLVESLVALTHWRDVLTAGDTNRLLARWRTLAPSSEGAVVTWNQQGRRRQGTTDGIDADGALRVRCEGRLERVVAGELTWVSILARGVTDAAGD